MNAEEKIAQLKELHHDDPSWRCAARLPVDQVPESIWEKRMPLSRPGHRHNLICTEKPGHEGLHKDALHCWDFHHFEATTPEQPEDAWQGRGCSCGTLDCKTRKILEED